jgi:hypothetical protein
MLYSRCDKWSKYFTRCNKKIQIYFQCTEPHENKTPMTADILKRSDKWSKYFTWCNKNKMNCEPMLTYDTPALRQTGSRNLTGQKMLPTIWGTYMKLVTKYQISAINSSWEKCDEERGYKYIFVSNTNVFLDSWIQLKQDFNGRRHLKNFWQVKYVLYMIF